MHTTPGQGVPPGYQRTELGILPTDWGVLTVGDLAKTSSGTTPPRAQDQKYFAGGTIPWVKTLDLNNSRITSTDEAVTPAALADTSLQIYPSGSVLVAMYGGFNQIGRTGLLCLPATVNQALTAIQPIQRQLHSGYLHAVLNFRVEYWRSVASSSRKDPNITSKDVRDFPIAAPPINEQAAIAEALSDADALIESLEQLLAKKREVKQGAMQQLLNGKVRLPGFATDVAFKQTEIGILPSDWGVVAIGEAGLVTGGRQLSPDYSGDLCKYLRVANVFDGYIDATDVLEMRFSPAEKERFLLKEDDILLNEGQSLELVGRSAIYRGVPESCCFQNSLIRFRAGPRTTSGFAQAVFQNYLRTGVFALIALQTTSIAHLGTGRLAALKMPLPSKAEQEAIAETLSDMDAAIELVETKLAKARQIKQAMMQELLTGRIRLM
jgi:type I restriction enzyme S subunit